GGTGQGIPQAIMISITFHRSERTLPARRGRPGARLFGLLAALAMAPSLAVAAVPAGEDGYALWLRYQPLQQASPLQSVAAAVVRPAATGTQVAARDELLRGVEGLSGRRPASVETVARDGVLVLGTPASSPLVAALDLG